MRKLIAVTIAHVALVSLFTVDADARPKPFQPISPTCGATLATPGRFRLQGDVGALGDATDCDAVGLTISVDGITLDLDGHTIYGDPDTGTNGILVTGDDAVLRNGVIREFDRGIDAQSNPRSFANIHTLYNSNVGIRIEGNSVDRPSTTLRDVSASHGGGGIALRGLNFVVRNATIADNVGDGMSTTEVGSMRLTNSDAHSNASGFVLDDVTTASVAGNRATGNNSNGFVLAASASRSAFSNNTASSNGGDGFNAAGDGITFSRNTATDNGESGIDATGANNRFVGNRLHGNALNGLFSAGSNAKIASNAANGNEASGLRAQNGTGITLNKNTTRSNGWGNPNGVGLGIDASGATSPTGNKNRASGNDDPDQCEPVTVRCSP
jgi:parallel beta-helix repeat protein